MFRALACSVRIAALLLCVCIPVFGQSMTFLPRQNYAAGSDPRSAAFADYNGDGSIDLVVGNTAGMGEGDYTLSVFLNGGGGSFVLSSTIPVDPLPYYVLAADFNNDNRPDVAIAHVSQGKVSILLGNGNGTFAAPQTVPTAGVPFSIVAGHLNGDSNIDLVASHYQGPSGGAGFVQVLLGNGNGTFTSTGNFGSGMAFYSALADFNDDSRLDIATTRGSSVGILFGNGDGTFAPGPIIPDFGVRGIVAADFNGDGTKDIAATDFDSPGVGHLGVALGNGNGTFQPTTSFDTASWPWGLMGADFNLDGRFDLVSANSGSGTISVLQGNGNGTFQAPMNITVGSSPYFAGVSDFNGDSIPDLAVTNAGSNSISILMNNATPPDSIWKTPVNAIAGQNSLTKFGGCDGCFDAGASTRMAVSSGDGFAEFSFPEVNGFRLAGLARTFSVTDGDSIDFGLRTQNGWVEVREGGNYRAETSAEPGAVFRITVQGGVVRYSKNGAVFYTSSGTVQYPFVFGALLGTANSAVQGVTFSGSDASPTADTAPTSSTPSGSGPVTWTSMHNVSFEGNTVRKTGGCDGCFDAFVRSEQTVGSSGYAEFTIADPGPFLLAGLAHSFTPGSAESIDFGIRIQGGWAEVRENGIYRSDIAAQPGAVFRISISGGVVSYSKDRFVFYSGPASAGSSTFGVLFGSMNASISNVLISNGS